MKSIGDRIKKARQDAGYNQDELAESVGVTRNTISRWECNRTCPTVEELKKISDFLNVDINLSETTLNEDSVSDRDIALEIKALAMNLEDIRLDVISVNEMKTRTRRIVITVVVVAILICVVVIGLFLALINWPANSDTQPIRIEYYEREQ